MLAPGPAVAVDPVEIDLAITAAPEDQWSKNRLQAELKANGTLVLKDRRSGDFNDASFWEIPFNRDLPYGRKELSVSIDVNPRHETLWGPKLLQPIVDSVEAEAAVDADGLASFEKSWLSFRSVCMGC